MDNRFSARPGTTRPGKVGIEMGGLIGPEAVALMVVSSAMKIGTGGILWEVVRLSTLLTSVSVQPVSALYVNRSLLIFLTSTAAALENLIWVYVTAGLAARISLTGESDSESDGCATRADFDDLTFLILCLSASISLRCSSICFRWQSVPE